MLARIEITDFALIEKAVLTPGPGLLIMTGETGAGKSILIDAISALGGERVSRDMVRHGQNRAVIEAVFQDAADVIPAAVKEQLGLDSDENKEPGVLPEPDDLILSREIQASGKSICRINGRLVSLAILRELAGWLIDIHGQHDQQAIFQTDIHLQLLDRFGGAPVGAVLQDYQGSWQEYQDCGRELAGLGQDPAERARQYDMLQYQIREIEGARIKPAEDETLAERRKLAANAGKISAALAEAHDLLDGESSTSVLPRLGQVMKDLEQVSRHYSRLDQTIEQSREAVYTLQAAAGDIQAALESIEADPGELDKIDERLDQLFRLKKKYGGSLPAVQDYLAASRQKLEQMADGDARYDQLQKMRREFGQKLAAKGDRLSAARQEAARGLEKQITCELADLGMKGVRFAVQFHVHEQDNRFTRSGQDQVEFLLSANPGEPLKPLARIASGGEASRIMLAIKTILAEADRIPVLIFDEIDSGVSGRTAGKVAEKLQLLSRGRQVFCITHLAQIASMADSHVLIEKIINEGKTRTELQWLDAPGREAELARLLSGGTGAGAARQLAAQLIQQATLFRQASVPSGTIPRSDSENQPAGGQ